MKLDLSLPIPQLKLLYTRAKSAYYNNKEKDILTDRDFDRLEDFLKEKVPNWKGFSVGSPVNNKKTKVKLPIPMFSLDKIKNPEQVSNWLTDSDDIVLMDKLDGASVELIYTKGVPTQLITRGNGTIGGDISFLIPHMKIPRKAGTKDFIVRCEGIFSRSAFQKYKKEFDAARPAASGVMNRRDVHVALKDLSVVALQLLEPNLKMSDGLSWLKRVGFSVVPNKVVPAARLNFNLLTSLLKKRKANSKYDCDGLVLVRNDKNKLPKAGNPTWGVAFKETVAVEDAPTTKVVAVHWKVSPHGYIIPRFEVSPIKMPDGSTVRFAAAKNPKMMMAKGIGVGSIVRLIKSGDIIPEIISVEKKAKVVLPSFDLKGPWHWDKTKTHIVLDDPKNSAEFRTQKLTRTFAKMKIDFLRGKTVSRLIDAGFDNVTRILNAKPKDFERVEGFKARSAEKLYQAIQNKVREGMTLPVLMDASGAFPRGVGETQLESVAKEFNLMQLGRKSTEEIIDLVIQLPGFQRTNAEKVAKGLPVFLKWMAKTGLRPVQAKKVKVKSNKLDGVNVTWTTYRSAEQEEIVKQNGGNVIGFSTKKTTVLLYSPTGKTSSKIANARDAGVRTMTWDEFARKYKLNT